MSTDYALPVTGQLVSVEGHEAAINASLAEIDASLAEQGSRVAAVQQATISVAYSGDPVPLSGGVWPLASAGEDAILYLDRSGNLGVPGVIETGRETYDYSRLAAEAYPVRVFAAPVDDGSGSVWQIFAADGASARRLTASAVDCHDPELIAPGVAAFAKTSGAICRARVVMDPPVQSTAIAMHVLHGQSLAGGSHSYDASLLPLLPSAPNDRTLSFNGGTRPAWGTVAYDPAEFASFQPAQETGGNDTGLMGFGFGLTLSQGERALVAASGNGGEPYANIKKGTQPWANMLHGVQRGADLAAAEGAAFSVEALHWRHGESNEGDNGTVYRGYVEEAFADFAGDVLAITGQAAAPVMLLQQINRTQASTYGGLAAYEIVGPARAVAGLVQSPAAGIHVVGPQYVCDFGDEYHMLPASYHLMAAYNAKALRRLKRGGWRPLHAVSAAQSGAVIDLDVAGGWLDYGGALSIDVSYVTDPGMFGVTYVDDAMSAQVAAVEISGRTSLRVTLDGVPTGASQRLGFAHYAPAEMNMQGRTTGLRCCIRDNDPDACPVTGLPLHNYMISHQIGV